MCGLAKEVVATLHQEIGSKIEEETRLLQVVGSWNTDIPARVAIAPPLP